jgi:hypothetical protein
MTGAENQPGWWARNRANVAASFLGIGLGAGFIGTASASPEVAAAPNNPCTKFGLLHERFNVCASYIYSSQGVLRSFLQMGNQDQRNPRGREEVEFAKGWLETHYYDGPRKRYEDEVAEWKKTQAPKGNIVNDNVDITALNVQEARGRAFVTTRENRVVFDRKTNNIQYIEMAHIQRTTMCDLPERTTPQLAWVVVADGFKNVDCKQFAATHP